jgi:glucose dehydrogenase
MIEAPTVDALMAGGLEQWLVSQTAMREDAKAKVRQRTIISLVAAVILFALVWAIWSVGAGFFTAVMLGGAGQLWAAAARTPVVNAIKQEMNQRIAAAMGCNFNSAAVPGPEFATARMFEMLPSFDNDDYEDQWQGEIAGRPFDLYEAHLQEWRGSGKNRRLETVFRGVLMTVGFARDFHGST